MSVSFSTGQFKLVKSLAVNSEFFTTDKFGNIYLLAEKKLVKHDSTGRFLFNYTELGTGNPNLVDVSNPLKLLLFYPDFAQIDVLDSKLALQSTVNLRSIGFQQPVTICYSYNEGIWIFDRQDFQLKRIDRMLNVSNESGNLVQILGYAPNPAFMIEENNFLYINNPETGILVFDIYGTYFKTIPLKNLVSFQVKGNQVVFFSHEGMGTFDLKTLEKKNFDFPVNNDSTLMARVENHQLFLLTNDSLKIYKF